MNCWEYKKCGREPGGSKASELGVCPAATESRTNGINSGRYGGRSCWAVAGTLCGGQVQGSAALKINNCMKCEFYSMVRTEEIQKGSYTLPAEIIRKISKNNSG